MRKFNKADTGSHDTSIERFIYVSTIEMIIILSSLSKCSERSGIDNVHPVSIACATAWLICSSFQCCDIFHFDNTLVLINIMS
jgi:hypothetical protein